jgi:hypothetical protein
MAKKKQMDKRTSNDPETTTQKLKDWGTRTPLTTGDELGCSVGATNSCSTSYILRVSVNQHEHHPIMEIVLDISILK